MDEQQLNTFITMVEEMRKAQREYFRGRMGRDLDRAKKYEKEVDRTIKEYRGNQIDKLQYKLF